MTLRIDPSMGSYFREIPVKTVVSDAAQAWTGLPNVPELLISDGEPGPKGYDSKSGASNGVYLIEDWKLAESSLAVTVATFETKSGKIVDTDILVNANHPFALLAEDSEDLSAEESAANGNKDRGRGSKPPPEHFDLRGVLTHEFGHVLGLGESFDVRLATMWPNVARGEIHQRDLHDDDREGAEMAYSETLMPEAMASAAGGCGGASVLVHRGPGLGSGTWMLVGAGMIAAGLWLRARGRRGARRTPMLALALLFGAPLGADSDVAKTHVRVELVRTLALRRMPVEERSAGLAAAAQSHSTEVRMTAAAVLERSGVREDLPVASALATDENPEVRRVALLALERLRTAPPAARVAATDPEAQARLKSLTGQGGRVVRGEAVRVGASMDGGLVWSHFLVHGENEVVEVQIPGGTLGDITQVISEQETPSDGSELIVAVREKGPAAWALYRDGLAYGGFLGDGPAIEID